MTIFANLKGRLKGKLSGGSMTTHVLAVSGAAAVGQAISLIAGPINSRLYQPSDYGALAVFTTMFGLFSVLGTMRYEMAMPVAEDDTEAAHLLLLCLLIACAWTVLAVLLVLVAGPAAARWLAKDNPQIVRYIWFLPVGVFATSFYTIVSTWAIRKRAFGQLSASRIQQSLLGSGSMVGLGFFHTGAFGLLTGSLVATCSGVRKLTILAVQDVRAQISRLSWAGMKAAALHHYRFPLYTTWEALVTSFSSNIPVFFLTKGFGSAYTGYFTLCNRILTLPATVIGAAIAPVFLSRMKQAHDEGTLKQMTIRLMDSIVGINAFFLIFLALFGEPLFMLAFGAKWQRSGQYAAALAPWILCSFLVTPLENLPLLYRRHAGALGFRAVLMGVRVGSLVLGVQLGNDLLAMWLFGGASALYMLTYLGWLLRMVEVPLSGPFLKLGKELLLAAAMLLPCRLLMWWSHGNLLLTGLALAPVLAYAARRGYRQITQGRASI